VYPCPHIDCSTRYARTARYDMNWYYDYLSRRARKLSGLKKSKSGDTSVSTRMLETSVLCHLRGGFVVPIGERFGATEMHVEAVPRCRCIAQTRRIYRMKPFPAMPLCLSVHPSPPHSADACVGFQVRSLSLPHCVT
jgi:hypothetical protein